MGKGKTSRKPGRTARANQRLNPIEQATIHRAKVLTAVAA